MKKAIRSLFGKKKSPRDTTQPKEPLVAENEAIERKVSSPSSRFHQDSSSGITNSGGGTGQSSTNSGAQLANEARTQPLDNRLSTIIHHNRPEPYNPSPVQEILQLQRRIRELETSQQENMQSTRDPGLPQKNDKGHDHSLYRASATTASSSFTGSSHQMTASHSDQGRGQESQDIIASTETIYHRSSRYASKTTSEQSSTFPVVRPLVDRSRVALNHTSRESPAHVGDIPGQRRLYFQEPALTNDGLTPSISKEIVHNSHSNQVRYRQSAPAGPVDSKNETGQCYVAASGRDSFSTDSYHSRSIYGSGNPYVYYDTLSRGTLSAKPRGTRTASPHSLYARPSPDKPDQGSLLVLENDEVASIPSSPSPLMDGNRDPSTENTTLSMLQGVVQGKKGDLKGARGKRIRKTLSIHWNPKEKAVSSKVVLPKDDERPLKSEISTASAPISVSLKTSSLSRAATITPNRSATKTLDSTVPTVRGPRPMPEIRGFHRETRAKRSLPQLPQKKSLLTDVTAACVQTDPSSEIQRRVSNKVTLESESDTTTTTSTSISGPCSEDEEGERGEEGAAIVYTRSTQGRRQYHQHHRRTSSPKFYSQALQQQQLQQMATATERNVASEPRSSLPRFDSRESEKQGKVLTAMDEFVNDTEEYIRKHEKSIASNPYHSMTEQHLREQAFFYAQRRAKERRILRTQSQEDAQSPVLSPAQIPSLNKPKEVARSSTSATSSVTNSILKKISTTYRAVGPIKRPTLDSVIGGNNDMSRSTPASLVPALKRDSNTLSNSNTTASRGTARRIIYSADLEQGLPKGRVAREGNFEIVPLIRGSGQFSIHSTGRTSAVATGKQLSGYETEIYPDFTPKEELSDENAKKVVVAHGTVLGPEFHSLTRERPQQQQQQQVQFSQDDSARMTIPNAVLDLKDGDLHRYEEGVGPSDYSPSFATCPKAPMNEFLPRGESRAKSRTKNTPTAFRALQQSQERLGRINQGSNDKETSRHVERFPALQDGRPSALPSPPNFLNTRQKIALQRREAREEVYLIQPIRIRSLFAILHSTPWTEKPTEYSESVDTKEAVLRNEEDTEQGSHKEQSEKSDEESLEMLILQDDHTEMSTRSSCESFHLALEEPVIDRLDPDGQLSQGPLECVGQNQSLSLPHPSVVGGAASSYSPLVPPSLSILNTRMPVLINGLTPEELLSRVRYEGSREGAFGYYGQQGQEGDLHRRQMEGMGIEGRERGIQDRKPYLRGKTFFQWLLWGKGNEEF